MQNQELINNFENYQVYQFGMGDSPEIFAFLKQCNDFSILVEGMTYEMSDVIGLLMESPPGFDLKDKHVLAVVNSSKQIEGIIDLVVGYPEKDIWFIGLILVAPTFRRNGIGTKIIHEIEKLVNKAGGKEIRLGVVEENSNAFNFWKKNEYRLLNIRPPVKFGLKEHRVMIFQKKLVL
jgi:ribosomal protein S18 acetylase RimI-like enzyme